MPPPSKRGHMFRMLRVPCLIGLLCAMFLSGVPAAAGPNRQTPEVPSAAPDVRTLGPRVGDNVPDFRLPDQHGQIRTLPVLLGPNGAVLVFFRSADW